MDWKDAGKEELPKSSSNYMKFEQGANKFRILSNPIMGWEYWTEGKGKEKGKPVRSVERPNTIPLDADLKNGWNPKYFWAFVVWNSNEKKIQILEITQSTILKPLQDLIQNEDWGDPREYSITINKKGEKLESEYNLVPSPKQPLPKEVTKLYEDAQVRLEALLEGGDPFDADNTAVAKENTGEVNFDTEDVPF